MIFIVGTEAEGSRELDRFFDWLDEMRYEHKQKAFM
jgi:hypothetical protein